MAAKPDAILGFVGDLLIDRDHPAEAFSDVAALLHAPDAMFGNLEAAFTDNPRAAPSLGVALFPGARNLDAFEGSGFDVLALANNHICDAGHEALLSTRARVRELGIATCGAGANLDDARKAALVHAGGVKVAYLAYASVFPMGYEARENMPGLAPLRGYDLWLPGIENYHSPGTPPRSQNVLDQNDLAHLEEDLESARGQADIVVASIHWGDYLKPYHLTAHERQAARWCLDHGADMVVGHHHHAVRGIEWYAGKPIFYGLGHFVFDFRWPATEESTAALHRLVASEGESAAEYQIGPRDGWPLLALHPDTRMTMFAWARVSAGHISDVGFVPCRLTPDGLVHPFDPSSPEGAEVVRYVERCNSTQGLNGRLEPSGGLELAGCHTVRVVPV